MKQQHPPENYMVWSILSTICCCFPIGVFAILESIKVNKLWSKGDVKGAQKASDKAVKITIWAIMAGVSIGIITFAFSQSYHVLDYLFSGY